MADLLFYSGVGAGAVALTAVAAWFVQYALSTKASPTSSKTSGEWTSLINKTDSTKESSRLAQVYYDVATDFYNFGWGQCYHFAPRARDETLRESVRRYEYWLAHRLGLKPGMKCLDVGCGIGGPAQSIARFSGADITGVTISNYQVRMGNEWAKKNNVDHLVHLVENDFMKMQFDDNTFDAAYACEATCHSGERTKCYAEIMRCLKPGGVFGLYEWGTTDKYDPNNPHHVKTVKQICTGSGLPMLLSTQEILKCVKEAGFEILDEQDVTFNDHARKVFQTPWYKPMSDNFSLINIAASVWGVYILHGLLILAEKIGLVPDGSVEAHRNLIEAAKGLPEGGRLGIFTHSYFVLARKPMSAAAGQA